MTIFIKNIVAQQVKIHSINLGLQKGETRKLVASFDNEFSDVKNELDVLVDDKQIEIIDTLGHTLTTSEIFAHSVEDSAQRIKDELIQSPELKEERFYYVEDMFCISKGEHTYKSFKGFADTLRISVKNKYIKYRIKSQGIIMPWQYLKQDKENILNFEYRLRDPEIEILSDSGDVDVNIYIDGYVTDLSPMDLQNFIDTWYEEQTDCDNSAWYGEAGWWNNNKITKDGEWSSWYWASKIGSFIDKTINDYNLSVGTKIVQHQDGAKIVIPQSYKTLNGLDSSDFKVFENSQGSYTIELVGYNALDSWNLNTFKVEVENIRFIEFSDQTLDVTLIEVAAWDDRWTDSNYYARTGLKFISEDVGFKAAIGSYTISLSKYPKKATLLIDDQNLLVPGQSITSLDSDEYDFFIIANGEDEVTMDSVITFDNNGDYPKLIVDGVQTTFPVYYSDPALNYDGKDHFIYKPDGNGGTNIYIEDLPGLGDEDFNDIVLNVNFPMTDKIIIHTPENISEILTCTNNTASFMGVSTQASGINAYAMGRIGEGAGDWKEEYTDCQVWRFRNGTDADLNVKVFHYSSKKTEYFTIPAKTDMYKFTPFEEAIKLYWYETDHRGRAKKRFSKKHHTYNMFRDTLNLKNETLKTITVINKSIFKG